MEDTVKAAFANYFGHETLTLQRTKVDGWTNTWIVVSNGPEGIKLEKSNTKAKKVYILRRLIGGC